MVHAGAIRALPLRHFLGFEFLVLLLVPVLVVIIGGS
jgi:hypothetical protein